MQRDTRASALPHPPHLTRPAPLAILQRLLALGARDSLRRVDLGGCRLLTEEGLAAFVAACPRVEFALLGGVTGATDGTLAAIARGWPALHTLELTSTVGVRLTADALAAWLAAPPPAPLAPAAAAATAAAMAAAAPQRAPPARAAGSRRGVVRAARPPARPRPVAQLRLVGCRFDADGWGALLAAAASAPGLVDLSLHEPSGLTDAVMEAFVARRERALLADMAPAAVEAAAAGGGGGGGGSDGAAPAPLRTAPWLKVSGATLDFTPVRWLGGDGYAFVR